MATVTPTRDASICNVRPVSPEIEAAILERFNATEADPETRWTVTDDPLDLDPGIRSEAAEARAMYAAGQLTQRAVNERAGRQHGGRKRTAFFKVAMLRVGGMSHKETAEHLGMPRLIVAKYERDLTSQTGMPVVGLRQRVEQLGIKTEKELHRFLVDEMLAGLVWANQRAAQALEDREALAHQEGGAA